MICDCKLAWIWGLRNETKNPKLREGLEELTCFLEATYEPKFDSREEFSQALEIVRNKGYQDKGPMDESQYLSDNYDDNYSDDENPPIGHQIEIDGKPSYVRRLFDLKPEDLPCPTPSKEEVMASEQPSGHRDHGSSSSIFSFSSGAAVSGHRSPGNLSFAILLVLTALTLFTDARSFT
ncbi:PREDICTED: uncharacterized protein LOC105361181 [Ceratosolen solmsi marchali]|uniref:Uncharacterized protein LOC105361181 n=1 Tax=Ceratosolen solmsi marchali TaxID=326594 RepID=A0AAJ6YEH8_9HYME|nr:PREDICTED: uncharacterized protein LOC105361181 [Ceratosolen solmsi marchali]